MYKKVGCPRVIFEHSFFSYSKTNWGLKDGGLIVGRLLTGDSLNGLCKKNEIPCNFKFTCCMWSKSALFRQFIIHTDSMVNRKKLCSVLNISKIVSKRYTGR